MHILPGIHCGDEALCREFARVFGVDFLSVLTRGSQFKVEAFMFRLAKPENFVLISPSREDVRCYLVVEIER